MQVFNSLMLSNNLSINLSSNLSEKMKNYIDERPFEIMIQDAKPSGKYEYIEEMIRRDQNIFRGDHTLYDNNIWEMETEEKEIKKELKAIAEKMEADAKLREKIAEAQAQAQSQPQQKNQKKQVFPKPMDSKEFEALFTEKLELQGKLQELEEKLALWQEVRDVTRKEFVTLNRIAKLYKKTGDENLLKKGVEWCCSYTDNLFLNIPNAINSVPGLVRPTPLSAQNLNGCAW